MDVLEFATFMLIITKKIIQKDYQNPYNKNLLNFIGYFVARIATIENDPEHSFEHPLLESTITGLLDVSSYVHVTINSANHLIYQDLNNGTDNSSLNICLLFSFILNNMGNEVVVSNHLGGIIQNVLLKNVKVSILCFFLLYPSVW